MDPSGQHGSQSRGRQAHRVSQAEVHDESGDTNFNFQVELELCGVRTRHEQVLAVRCGELCVKRAVATTTIFVRFAIGKTYVPMTSAWSPARWGGGRKSTVPPVGVGLRYVDQADLAPRGVGQGSGDLRHLACGERARHSVA